MRPEALTTIIEKAGFRFMSATVLEGSDGGYRPIPSALCPSVSRILGERFPDGLYSHQADALDQIASGKDVCLATSTASGKSLVFIAGAANLLTQDANRKVLAVYPARALIQDQFRKWQDLLGPLGFRAEIVDGGIPVDQRARRLQDNHVILMTPDVLHTWVMSNLNKPDVIGFVQRVGLTILDEAHVYEGVFGTNMAYLLRRLQMVASRFTLVCSTATIGGPSDFINSLTGRTVRVFGTDRDGSKRQPKTLIVGRPTAGRDKFADLTALLRSFSQEDGRFLAFADSRKMVEQLVASVNRQSDGDLQQHQDREWKVLPYRAGYEDDDRKKIQGALERGDLSGVVSTSALELGLDIGDINLVVLLDTPPSVKAFWQRIGRAGRRDPGSCLFIDSRGIIPETSEGLRSYLNKPLEQNYLYLENRYVQYTNALCAAAEIQSSGYVNEKAVTTSFKSVPKAFVDLLKNEINPTEAVAQDLYALKQRAQNGPHREFPIRAGMEKNLEIEWSEQGSGQRLGTVMFGQAIREAYPGAVYYYMARPYRVFSFDYRNGKIKVHREGYYTTRPKSQTMVFPRFQSIHNLFRSDRGFLAEVDVQVSEQVLGFVEKRGRNQTENLYGPGSPYYQFPINRLLETTGVCWYLPDQVALSEVAAATLLEAFCLTCGVQGRDLGVGRFHAQQSPFGAGPLQGMCIFDSTQGSLRLTEKLALGFRDIVLAAIQIARAGDLGNALFGLERLLKFAESIEPVVAQPSRAIELPEGWIQVVAAGERAIYDSQDGAVEVEVVGYWPTAEGMTYRLKTDRAAEWRVPLPFIRPLGDQTRIVLLNPNTGEIGDLDSHSSAASAGVAS